MMEQFEVIYEDAHILVVYKPAGVPTQTARIGQQDMVSLLKNYRMKKGEKPYIGLIHRLDQPVEGILVFAKDEKSAAKLSSQVQKHTMKKKYYGLVEGCPLEEEAILENRMAFDKRNNSSYLIVEKREAVPGKGGPRGDEQREGLSGEGGQREAGTFHFALTEKQAKGKGLKLQNAKLSYKVVNSGVVHNAEEKKESSTCEDRVQTVLDISLFTGRHHQIRLQMAGMGCPLVGDQKYGHGAIGQNVALCAYGLEFEHPATGEHLTFGISPKNPLFS